jgi:hypothetical protein
VSSGNRSSPRIRHRLAQIADRLDELRAGSYAVSDADMLPLTDRERLARAAAHAGQARAHAAEAAELAVSACLRSAEVHERLAALYELLAGRGKGDVTRYRRQAELHRRLAKQDRATSVRKAGRADAAAHRLSTG